MNPYLDDGDFRLYVGDVRQTLAEMPAESVDCVVTSPPYWGLRNYGTPPILWDGAPDCDHEWGGMERGKRKDLLPSDETTVGRVGLTDHQDDAATDGGRFCLKCDAWLGHYGLEPTVDLYVAHTVAIFREMHRVLAPHGTVWLNLGDSYVSDSTYSTTQTLHTENGWKQDSDRRPNVQRKAQVRDSKTGHDSVLRPPASPLPAKNLVGVPWRVALALQDDGWILRSDIIWAKPNCMPESVTDRPTKSHEYVFLLAKSERYYFDGEAIREQARDWSAHPPSTGIKETQHYGAGNNGNKGLAALASRYQDGSAPAFRNVRTVWEIATQSYKGAHFAVFPPKLAERCVLAGTPEYVCTICGKPRERIVEKGEPVLQENTWSANGAARYDDEAGGYVAAEDTSTLKHVVPRETLGWTECGCAYGLKPDDLEVILSPVARDGHEPDPTLDTGRKGLGRPRAEGEGTRPMTRYEQRAYARQLQQMPDPMRETVINTMTSRTAWEHYARTDRAGARPMPPDLIEHLIALDWIERVELPNPTPGTYRPGVVLDPFMGSGTTALVARQLGRHSVGIELNPDYAELCAQRCQQLSLLS